MARSKEKKSRRHDSGTPIEEQFRGPHPPDCKCPSCTKEREEQKRITEESSLRKKAMAKEGRIRRFYGSLRSLKHGILSFWTALHDILSAMLSFITVIALVSILWLLISRLWAGEWIVPLVCLGGLVVIGWVNERLG